MHRRSILATLLVLGGVLLAVYGLAVGDRAVYSVQVGDSVREDALSPDIAVIEYDRLSPPMQDAFRDALAGDSTRISGPPDTFDHEYVHYRGSYFHTVVVHGDAVQTRMAVAIAGGILLILVGVAGWLVVTRRSDP